MPTMEDIGKLATELYGVQVGAKQNINSGLTLDASKASSLGFTESEFYVWSGEENNYNAYFRGFYSSGTNWYGNNRHYINFQALCLGD